jgi:hypothetical protein
MHVNLFFNGCSYTEGQELEGIEKNKEYQRLNRFSHIVSERLNKTYDNISFSGASNDRIVRTTIDWFESGNTCDISIIQLTQYSRIEWHDDNGNPVQFGIWKMNFKSYNNRMYYRFIDTEAVRVNNYYKNLFLLETYFELKGIKHYFLTLEHCQMNISSSWKDRCKNQDIVKITDIIDCFWKDKTYYCEDLFSKYNKDCKFLHYGGRHPNELGHQKIAEHIIDNIEPILKE